MSVDMDANAGADASKLAERLRAALKPRPFATAASAAAPTARTSAPLWMWAQNADGSIPPPVPESYEAVPDAPKPFRLGESAQDPYALCASAGGAACEPDHNYSWNEFAPRDGQMAQVLEKAANAAAVARAMAMIAKMAKAAAGLGSAPAKA
jgi:hypothetical protein